MRQSRVSLVVVVVVVVVVGRHPFGARTVPSLLGAEQHDIDVRFLILLRYVNVV